MLSTGRNLKGVMTQELNRSDYYKRIVGSRKLNGFALTQKQVAGFILTETAFSRGFRLPTHSHRYHSLSVVLEGSFGETKGNIRRRREPYDVDLTQINQPHAADFLECRVRCFNLEIPVQWVERVRGYSNIFEKPGVFPGNSSPVLSALMMRLYRESHYLDSVSALIVESVLFEIIAVVSRQAKEEGRRRAPLWLVRASEMIHDQFSENLTLAYLAKTAGVHPVYLASTFRRFYGCSIGEHLRRLRIDFACRALVKSEASIADIALKAGFADHSHLCKTFKKKTGLTPSEYRATALRS